MKRKIAIVAFIVLCSGVYADAQDVREIANPSIDMKAFLRLAQEAAVHRQTRRLTEDEFIEMSRRPGVVVLDARSREKFDELHVKGAVNLSFPDMTWRASRAFCRTKRRRSSFTAITISLMRKGLSRQSSLRPL